MAYAYYVDQKKRRTYVLIDKTDVKNDFNYFQKKKTFWKIFKKSVNLDQYQVCISNNLGARALQREALIYENAFLYRDCEIEMGNVFIQTNAISKPKKIAIPAWR